MFIGDISGQVPPQVWDVLAHRTPGFASWQGEEWQTHCGDACAYLGTVGWDQLVDLPTAQASLIDDGMLPDDLPLIRKDGDLCGYLFRCLHCGERVCYVDAS